MMFRGCSGVVQEDCFPLHAYVPDSVRSNSKSSVTHNQPPAGPIVEI